MVGGIESHVRELAVSLSKKGHDVQVLTSDSPIAGIEKDGNVRVIRSRHSLSYLRFVYLEKRTERKFIPPLPDFLLTKSLRKTIRIFGPNVIHAHGRSMYTVGALRNTYHQLPMVSTLHDFGFFCAAGNCFDKKRQALCNQRRPGLTCVSCAQKDFGALKSLAVTASISIFRSFIKRFDRNLAVSNYVANLAREAGFRNVTVVPNFINLREFQKTLDLPSYERHVSSDVLCVMGRLVPDKGVNVILKAYNILKKESRHLDLTLIGKVEPRCPIFLTHNPKIRVFTNVPRDLVVKYMQNTKILVVPPTTPETFGLVALEGMAAKKPVVASAVGGLKELVEDHKTGLLVPPDDHIELAKAIIYLLKRPKLAEEMGMEGCNVVAKEYSANKIVPVIESIYERVRS